MKVKRNTLLLLACLIWSAAGFNILRIGLMAGGIWLRSSGLTPERFIAFLYRSWCVPFAGGTVIWPEFCQGGSGGQRKIIRNEEIDRCRQL